MTVAPVAPAAVASPPRAGVSASFVQTEAAPPAARPATAAPSTRGPPAAASGVARVLGLLALAAPAAAISAAVVDSTVVGTVIGAAIRIRGLRACVAGLGIPTVVATPNCQRNRQHQAE